MAAGVVKRRAGKPVPPANELAAAIAAAHGLGPEDGRRFMTLVRYLDDPIVLAAARKIAEIALCRWIGIPTVAPNVMLYVMTEAPTMHLRDVDAEVRRVTRALVDLGLVARVGRGRGARLEVSDDIASGALCAAAITYELQRAGQVEGLVEPLVRHSPALALLGLKEGRARVGLDRAFRGALRLDYLMGRERVLLPTAFM